LEFHKVLLGCSNAGLSDGWDMQHAWERCDILVETPKKRGRFGDLGASTRIILKRILKKIGLKM
jgi:hypothetical protein